ncbi:hypothetical protein OEB99_06135 [Actinotalea sp. M2MS4P-6]|uniref:FtsX-like permease family protein n=1 Tax=Actinotalea sp. M2MS4P-6 TaxID=2983762 RepID=UPI0021E4677F|nr:hypothetical protein [Actinotalea sp. M2MS4P-6]MCV2393880.1 hypothetical protein [Actinotalea sp. M2MS4P-6]
MIRVLRRQLGWDLVLVGLVTAALVALTVAWPRALDRLLRDDLVSRTEALPATQRDLTLTVPKRDLTIADPPDADAAQAMMAQADAWTAAQVADAGPALTSVLGEPQHEITRPSYYVERGDDAPGISYMTVTLSAGPRRQDLDLVEGTWPAPLDTAGWIEDSADAGRLVPVTMDVVVSVDAARWMGWSVGDVKASRDPSYPVDLRLSGLVEATDPDSEVWDHLPGVLEPVVDRDDNTGWTVHGIAYIDPDGVGAMMPTRGVELDAWYPVDPVAVGDADREELTAELAGLRAATGLRTQLTGVLDTASGRERTATTLLSVLVTGLIGAATGVLWLAARLAIERRRAALVLLRARGASSVRLAALVGTQAAAAALPGAAVGVAIAMQVPGRTDPTDLVLPAAVTIGAVALMVVAGARVHAAAVRRARWRWVAEVVVLAIAAVALMSQTASDPLVTTLPVIVGLAAALVAMRVYPWPARAALHALSRRGDLGTFLGVARAARVPAAGLITVLALTLGVATAGLAVTAVATVNAATERSAVRYVGSDVRVDLAWSAQGVGLPEDQVAAVRELPGVAELAAIADAGTVELRHDRSSQTIHLLVADGADLARVQSGIPGGVQGLGGTVALVAEDVPTGEVVLEAPRGDLALEAQASADVPGVTSGSGWVLLDRSTWAEARGTPPVTRLLLRLEPGAEPDAVVAAVRDVVDDRVTVTTLDQAIASIAQGVLVTGVRDAMLLVAATSLLLVAVLLVLLLIADAPARGRSAAILATLGAPGTVHRRLVVADVLGPVLVGGLAGAAAGAVLPYAVLRVADLRPFTGAVERPPVVLDPALLLAAGGGLVLVAAVGVLIAVRVARRVSPVEVLREGAGG